MAIQFIIGGSGTGKTTYIYNQMIEKTMQGCEQPVLFMLPEQANMSAEQEMIRVHPKGGTMDISVLSFTRLAFKIFDELNVHTKDVLDDFGKSMLIMRVLKQQEENLTYFGSMIKKQGFVDEIKSILSEFYQYQITQKKLDDVIEKLNPEKSLFHKLSDVRVIMKAFEEALQDSYMVTEQLLSLLKEVLVESQFLRGADIYFDGFTGFTPAQFCVIEELMKLQCNLFFSVTMDDTIFGNNNYSEQGLFSLSKQMIDRLCKLAQDMQVPVLPHVAMACRYRQSDKKALLHLENSLFRFPVCAYEKNTDEIEIVTACDEKEEIDFLAKYIQSCVREKQYAYSDFAIVYGDIMQKNELVKQAMERHKVPYFMDYSEPMKHNPLAEFMCALRDVFLQDFSYESVFGLLKTGFFDMEKTDICLLENYVVQYGVRGYNWWKQAFRGGVKGLGRLNEIRQVFMDKMEPLMECFGQKKAMTKQYIYALYDFMSTNGIAEKIHAISVQLERDGMLREAKAYSQVYEKCLDVFDKMIDIMGEEEIERDILMELIQTGIRDMKLGVIPSTLDQVVIGDIERTRLQNVKVLLIAGLNEGILPKNEDGKGILAERDREQLKGLQMELAPTAKEDVFLQQFYFYLQITKASEKIVLSFREKDMMGGAMRPSYYLNRICMMFPQNKIKHVMEYENLYPVTEQGFIHDFATQLLSLEEQDSSYLQIVKEEFPEQYAKIMQGYFYQNNEQILEQSLARKLYGDHMIHSVSRLETYSACAYQFFLQYGLKLKKNEIYSIETTHIGTILHAVMETFFTWVRDEKIDISTMEKTQLEERVEHITKEAAKKENETIFESSFRNRHMLDVMVRISKRSVDNLCRHLTQGDMQPTYFEEVFSPEKQLDYIDMALMQGVKMEMRGIVDRVDIKETEEAVYFKVIDYKSGAKDIDFIKMYEGRQLQLTVYMSVMEELLKRQFPNKKIIPTGMYYYHLYDPIIEEEDDEKLEQKRIDGSRLSGLVNKDEECLQIMDHKTGTVTPVKYKKDGDFSATNKSLVTAEELNKISKFVREKMIEIGNDMVAGKIAMNPEKGEISSPCNVCDYKSVCRFEAGLGGNGYKIAPQMSKEEAKKCVLGEEESHELDNRSEEDH
ncbi:MAG: PD-(D/E)XK nuclease family protein [Eubacteriales bacterium]|nr:PD-(D/E)XK nuclease family protein [Eubacteriales bacterium]